MPDMNPISDAKAVATKYRSRGVLILAFTRTDYMAASYGMTRADCEAMQGVLDQVCEAVAEGHVVLPPGFGSEEGERHGLDVEALEAQRDALLAACEEARVYLTGVRRGLMMDPDHLARTLDAALALARRAS